MPADFLTLRGEQTKLLIKRPMTERTVGGMGFDRVPFTIFYLFLSTSAAEGSLAVICFVKITVANISFIVPFYKVHLFLLFIKNRLLRKQRN